MEETLDDDTRLKLAIEKRDKLQAKSQKIAGKKQQLRVWRPSGKRSPTTISTPTPSLKPCRS